MTKLFKCTAEVKKIFDETWQQPSCNAYLHVCVAISFTIKQTPTPFAVTFAPFLIHKLMYLPGTTLKTKLDDCFVHAHGTQSKFATSCRHNKCCYFDYVLQMSEHIPMLII